VLDHGGERGKLPTVEVHISDVNANEELLAVLIRQPALASMA
jgi:hypothetical protein